MYTQWLVTQSLELETDETAQTILLFLSALFAFVLNWFALY